MTPHPSPQELKTFLVAIHDLLEAAARRAGAGTDVLARGQIAQTLGNHHCRTWFVRKWLHIRVHLHILWRALERRRGQVQLQRFHVLGLGNARHRDESAKAGQLEQVLLKI